LGPDITSRAKTTPREGSKLAQVIVLLKRSDGATIANLMDATGWLPHTTRAALTGLRKRGYVVVRERIDGGDSFYRIPDADADGADGVGNESTASNESAVEPRLKASPVVA
jgi:Protein of unknown function (DUF3489)